MITLSRLDGQKVVVNSDLIESIEATPDTHISFVHGKRLIVRESPEDVVARVIEFRRASGARGMLRIVTSEPEEDES